MTKISCGLEAIDDIFGTNHDPIFIFPADNKATSRVWFVIALVVVLAAVTAYFA